MNVPSSRKRCRLPTHADTNDAMYELYSLARERNIPLTGPMLQEEALQVASRLGNTSNGWLKAFKKRNNIKQLVVSGESANVSDVTIEARLERLPSILRGYFPEDIWNQDETGCISGTQSFQENRHIYIHLLVVHNPLVPLIGRLVACSA